MPEFTKEARERLDMCSLVESRVAHADLRLALSHIDALEARVAQVERGGRVLVAEADRHFKQAQESHVRAEKAEARVAVLAAARDSAAEVAVWMSGSDDFSPGGKAREGWEKARVRLYAAMAAGALDGPEGGSRG